ncbi:MAG: 5-formyltetrahydrofolate cyclo-ligase [Rhodocyclaceae bacterium]|nr:5-formyltetrahydrofolate cyclo-ligase [Rhodocyclaceae bacterium]MCB1893375.1 5-formyltetrahydrofolate cyclo-ligase [Rhodocyclaceae bacterium]MCW5596886.1 5-formyltetrahydrofolate cyclo-ligase [Rhodocyclaceae bacterium]
MTDSAAITDLRAYRNALRSRLIAAREALPAAEHARLSQAIERHLADLVDATSPRILAFCWPFRAEFDARSLIAARLPHGLRACLPVVMDSNSPLEFREWTPHSEMIEDRYGIHIPARRDVLRPDAILMPLNGFDGAGYRLGYGGGYFDRSLAGMNPRPLAIGVGFELARLDSIRPQAHDLPMDFIVTEAGAFAVANGRLNQR